MICPEENPGQYIWHEYPTVKRVIGFLGTPPAYPRTGDSYAVWHQGASQKWGEDNAGGKIATWDGATWTYITPGNGTIVEVVPTSYLLEFNGTSWSAPALHTF